MEVDFDVRMDVPTLFDYLFRHTYTGIEGIAGISIGLIAAGLFIVTKQWMYLIAAVIVFCYPPLTLLFQAMRQIRTNPAFKDVIHYHLGEEGVAVSQGTNSQTMHWERMHKAVETGKSIILYTGPVNASIFPKKDLGEKESALRKTIALYLEPGKNKLKKDAASDS